MHYLLTQVFVLGLALIAKNTSWDAVRDSFVDICVEGMNSLNPNAEAQITCEAVMDGQGPHVSHSLSNRTTNTRRLSRQR